MARWMIPYTKYKPQYCLDIIEHLEQGLSLASFCAKLNVSNETVMNWRKTFPEFSDAYKIARTKQEAYWESQFVDYALGEREGNSRALIFYMQNRFDWKTKEQLSGDKENPLTLSTDIKRMPTADIDAEITRLQKLSEIKLITDDKGEPLF